VVYLYVDRRVIMSENQSKNIVENEGMHAKIMERLETVIDPELGIDIVNLGLVYEVQLYKDGLCEVQVTLTTMGCPFGQVIEEEIIRALSSLPEIQEINVKFIWYPAWDPSRMSRYAKIALGIK